MELTDIEKALISDLINVAWQAGAVKAPQMAQALEDLRAKLVKKEGKLDGGK